MQHLKEYNVFDRIFRRTDRRAEYRREREEQRRVVADVGRRRHDEETKKEEFHKSALDRLKNPNVTNEDINKVFQEAVKFGYFGVANTIWKHKEDIIDPALDIPSVGLALNKFQKGGSHDTAQRGVNAVLQNAAHHNNKKFMIKLIEDERVFNKLVEMNPKFLQKPLFREAFKKAQNLSSEEEVDAILNFIT